MAKRYHITPRTNDIGECEAKFQCPFGDVPHFDSIRAAREWYEQKNNERMFPSFQPGLININPLPKSMRVGKDTIRVKKGVYVVGDPFFALGSSRTDWDLWKQKAEHDSTAGNAIGACYNEFPVLGLRTENSVGTFVDQHGREYPCESGYIGLIPMRLLRRMGVTDEEILDSGTIVTFSEVTTVQFHEGGTVSFGDNLDVYTEKDIYDDPIDLDEFLSYYETEVDEPGEGYDDGSNVVSLDEQIRRWN